jgi:acyl carrier protein
MTASIINKIEIEKIVLAVMQDTLKNPAIDSDSSVDNVDEWDSLGHLMLVMALEETLGVTFSFFEIVEISSFGKIVDSLITKDIM